MVFHRAFQLNLSKQVGPTRGGEKKKFLQELELHFGITIKVNRLTHSEKKM